jgi:hypothetical protein
MVFNKIDAYTLTIDEDDLMTEKKHEFYAWRVEVYLDE